MVTQIAVFNGQVCWGVFASWTQLFAILPANAWRAQWSISVGDHLGGVVFLRVSGI